MSSTASVDGLVSGLNTSQIIEQLMSLERQPQVSLQNSRNTLSTKLGYLQTLSTNIADIATQARLLNLNTYWKTAKGSTSDDTVATVSTSSGASQGSLTFSVSSLAKANIKSSSGSVASLSAQAANANFLLAQGGSIGLGAMQGSSGLSLGDHTFKVTTASTGASKAGTVLADSVTVASGDTITLDISGSPKTINLTAGTYTRRELADMISTASGGTVTASVNASKGLTLTTTREGSAATINVTGGVNLSNLGLTTGAGTAGTNGVIEVDGVANTVTDMNPSSTSLITLNGSGADTVAVGFVSGLREGTVTAKNVSYGDGKLQTVVDNINAANTGIVATAVQVGSNQYKLQLTSTAQGVAGSVSTDARAFSSFVGSLDDLVAGSDAKIVVGSGANEYSLSSSSNTVTGVLPNVTISLLKTSTEPVTITIDKDYDAIADKVKTLVDKINTALSYIKSNSGYDAANKKAGALLGDSTFTMLQGNLISAVNSMVGTSTYGSSSSVGITLQSDGTFAFDKDKFIEKMKAAPEEVAKLFLEGGTAGTSTTGTNPGIIDRLISFQDSVNGAGVGLLYNRIQSSQNQISDYDDRIADWDTRLTAKEASLRAQFTAMETALGQLKNIQSQLSGQLNQLS